MKPKVYIASPYSNGDQIINAKAQYDVFNKIIHTKKLIPFAPLWATFQHFVYPLPYEMWLEWDFEWVKACDCVLRLPGVSSGADAEVKTALDNGKLVFYTLEELFDHYKIEHESN
jgi:hypothetical protein